MELSKRTVRQIENTSGICKFDIENGTVSVPLYYQTPDDLLDTHLSCPGKPVVSDDTTDYLCEIIMSIPREFKVEFSLTIGDYGDYDHESLMRSLRATIENTFYYHDDNNKKHNILAIVFIAIGMLMLALETIGGISGWFGAKGNIGRSILETILDVMVWVFVWEGAALLFLTYEDESTAFSSNMDRLCGIKLLNKSGEVLNSLNQEQFYDGWVYLGHRENLARNYILFSNAALLAVLPIFFMELIANFDRISPIAMVFILINGVMTVFLILSNISFYRERGRLRKYALLLSATVLIISVFNIIRLLVNGNNSFALMIPYLIMSVALIINIICLQYLRKLYVNVDGKGNAE